MFFSQVISFLILVEFLMFHLIYLATCQCTSQRIIGPKSGLCISSPQKGNHLQCFQTQNCYPCSCFLFLFFGKHPFSFTADALDLSAATELILQNIFLRYMFPHIYRMALGLEMKKVDRDQVSHTTVLAQWYWE